MLREVTYLPVGKWTTYPPSERETKFDLVREGMFLAAVQPYREGQCFHLLLLTVAVVGGLRLLGLETENRSG
jgi:hypothetical protein